MSYETTKEFKDKFMKLIETVDPSSIIKLRSNIDGVGFSFKCLDYNFTVNEIEQTKNNFYEFLIDGYEVNILNDDLNGDVFFYIFTKYEVLTEQLVSTFLDELMNLKL